MVGFTGSYSELERLRTFSFLSFTNILFKDTLCKVRVTHAKLVLGAVLRVLALDVVVLDLAGPLVGGGVASQAGVIAYLGEHADFKKS